MLTPRDAESISTIIVHARSAGFFLALRIIVLFSHFLDQPDAAFIEWLLFYSDDILILF